MISNEIGLPDILFDLHVLLSYESPGWVAPHCGACTSFPGKSCRAFELSILARWSVPLDLCMFRWLGRCHYGKTGSWTNGVSMGRGGHGWCDDGRSIIRRVPESVRKHRESFHQCLHPIIMRLSGRVSFSGGETLLRLYLSRTAVYTLSIGILSIAYFRGILWERNRDFRFPDESHNSFTFCYQDLETMTTPWFNMSISSYCAKCPWFVASS